MCMLYVFIYICIYILPCVRRSLAAIKRITLTGNPIPTDTPDYLALSEVNPDCVYVFVCIYVSLYICVCVYEFIYACVCIYIYTYV